MFWKFFMAYLFVVYYIISKLNKMKNNLLYLSTAALIIAFAGCKKYDDGTTSTTTQNDNAARFAVHADYTITNLVSDTVEYNPQHIDTNLVNAWGMAWNPNGPVWISAAETHVSTIYDRNGNTLRSPVYIPFPPDGGNPTGQVYNSTSAFIIPATSQVSKFIFVTENGTVAAWASGDTAYTVADRSSSDAVYKGVEMVSSGGQWYLYATDFHNAKVDIFDQNFNFVGNNMFADATIPAGFAPFNIRNIDSKLYVTYAKQLAPDNEDDESGPGNGYVNTFDLDGSNVHRFVSQGLLNSPWGLEVGRTNGGASAQSQSHAGSATILVGNFGDGHINAYDSNGNFLGALMSNGSALEIEGLWAISYPPQTSVFTDVRNRLYFTAGPDDEEHGVFGYISKE
jgi:uncharacterized protein (TIGR03118 family)